jgi:hypothetical protein
LTDRSVSDTQRFPAVEERAPIRQIKQRALFREVNRRIRDVNAAFGSEGPYHLVCECARFECASRIEVAGDVFDTVCGDPDRFLVAPGHDDPEHERVVAGNGVYSVVTLEPETLTAA